MEKGGVKDQNMLSKMKIVGDNMNFSHETFDIV